MWTVEQLQEMMMNAVILPCNFACRVEDGEDGTTAAVLLFIAKLGDGSDAVVPYAPALSRTAVQALIKSLQAMEDDVTWIGGGDLEIVAESVQ
jgi:hypothetical protein